MRVISARSIHVYHYVVIFLSCYVVMLLCCYVVKLLSCYVIIKNSVSLVSFDFVCHESDITIKWQSDVYKDEWHSHEKGKLIYYYFIVRTL